MTQIKKEVVHEYLNFYDTLIKSTIKKNNQQIYSSLQTFLTAATTQLAAVTSSAASTDQGAYGGRGVTI